MLILLRPSALLLVEIIYEKYAKCSMLQKNPDGSFLCNKFLRNHADLISLIRDSSTGVFR